MVDTLRKVHVTLMSWARARGDVGASLVEYALLVALIALVAFVAVEFLGTSTSEGFSTYEQSLTAAQN